MDYKWYAALAYVRANRLNYNVIEGPNDRFGIIASGKGYNDTRQALSDLGLDDATCRRIGLRLHKVNVVWPLEATITRDFAEGLRGDPRRRGEAPGHRVPAEGRALRLAPGRSPARARQVRRARRRRQRRRVEPGQPEPALAAARAGRPVAGDHRARDRQAARQARRRRRRRRRHGDADRADRRQGEEPRLGERSGGERRDRDRRARAVVLQRLPAQHEHQGARGLARGRRHRLPLHGGVDEPLDGELQPDGRRRRLVGRPGAVHDRPAHLRQPRRRHLLPLGSARGAPGDRRQGQHHLQDPVQRRGRDDRRPADRRHAAGPRDDARARRRGRGEGRRRHRRAGEVRGARGRGAARPDA